jgi:hypothetical protein
MVRGGEIERQKRSLQLLVFHINRYKRGDGPQAKFHGVLWRFCF